MDDYLRIAILGCGAVTENRHLPALVRRDDCRIIALVDHDAGRASRLAADFSVSQVFTHYRDLLNLEIDAAIVALPNNLHAPVSVDLLKAGINLLVEKPMAISATECDSMLAAAEEGRAIVAVGLMRRFLHAGRFAKWAIESGLLGDIISFDMRDGFVFDWPLASDFFFRGESAGGGVLMDTGPHTLDQMLWWLGEVDTVEYYDDYHGGVESECELHVTLKSGVQGIIELSRMRTLRNTAIIQGKRAELEVGLWQNLVSLRFPGAPVEIFGEGAPHGQPFLSKQTQIDIITAEHDDLFTAIRTGCVPAVSGVDGKRPIVLIEACYATRRPLMLPWMTADQRSVDQEVTNA